MYPSESEFGQVPIKLVLVFPPGFAPPIGEALEDFSLKSRFLGEKLVALITKAIPKLERQQLFEFHLVPCTNPDCAIAMPHVISKIVSETQLSEATLIALSKCAGADVKMTQQGTVIHVSYQ